MRATRTWLLSIPLIAAGSLAAHSLAYRLALPDEHARELTYRHSGHAYLKIAPYVSALCVALVLAVVLTRALRPAAERTAGRITLWPFLALPLLFFALQEHAERFVGTGSFPAGAMLETTCLLGVALQVPLGVIAYAVARALVRLSDGLGRLLAGRGRTPRLRPKSLAGARFAEVAPARISILALNRAGRAPPISAVA
jgi:hypothetical protein